MARLVWDEDIRWVRFPHTLHVSASTPEKVVSTFTAMVRGKLECRIYPDRLIKTPAMRAGNSGTDPDSDPYGAFFYGRLGNGTFNSVNRVRPPNALLFIKLLSKPLTDEVRSCKARKRVRFPMGAPFRITSICDKN